MPVRTTVRSRPEREIRTSVPTCASRPSPARRRASGWPAISAMKESGKFPNDFTGWSVRCATVAVKVAVVGGGSTYTPELIEGLIAHDERLPIAEIALLDIDEDRLRIVGDLADRMLRRVGWGGGPRRNTRTGRPPPAAPPLRG